MAAEAAASQLIGGGHCTENVPTVRTCGYRQNDNARPFTKPVTSRTGTNPMSNDQPIELEGEELKEFALFQYRPLDTSKRMVRLLKILPESQSNSIECKLMHCTLDDCPPYTALSYTWDHDAHYEYIECHGKPLPVTRNLRRFLAQFRTTVPDEPQLLWVDAISIDQHNVQERNHQVGIMREIYSLADLVIVWLGEADDEADLAFGFLEGPKQLITGEGHYHPDLRLHRSYQQWRALERLFNRPYWSRVWIIQEFILAKSVALWCGRLTAHLESFQNLCRWLGTKWHLRHPPSSRVLQTKGWTLSKHRALWWQENETSERAAGFSLRDLLRVYSSSQSSDLRDKIYAFLGIASDITNGCNPLYPDYAKKPVRVFVDVIRNQCQWVTPENGTDTRGFISLLRKILCISHSEAATYILEYAPDLHPHIHYIVDIRSLYARMHCKSTIFERLLASAASGLLDRMNDAETESILSYEFERTSNGDRDPDAWDEAVLWYERNTTWGPFIIQPTLRLFVGTDGIIGLTLCSIKPGDRLYTFEGTKDWRGALIMQQMEPQFDWTAIGSAFIVQRQIYHHSRLPSPKVMLDQRHSSKYDTDLEFPPNHQVSGQAATPRCFFHITYLLELLRCRLVDPGLIERYYFHVTI